MLPGAAKALDNYQSTIATMKTAVIIGLVVAAVIVIAIVIRKKARK